MSDATERLNAARSGRYAIERELGAGERVRSRPSSSERTVRSRGKRVTRASDPEFWCRASLHRKGQPSCPGTDILHQRGETREGQVVPTFTITGGIGL